MSKTKFKSHFNDVEIAFPVEGKWVPCKVNVYGEGIELELWKMVTHKNKVIIHKKMKTFDFKDLLLMNETLTKIYSEKHEA